MKLRIYEIYDAKLLYKDGASVAKVDIWYAKAAAFNPQEQTIEFEGDGQTTKIFLLTGLDIELAADAWSLGSLDSVFGDTPVTTGLPTGIAERRYFGDESQSSVVCGLECKARAINDADGSTREVFVVVPVATLSAVAAPALKSKDKAAQNLKLSATKTDKDVAGVALPGLAAGKSITWYLDVSSAI